VNIRHDVLNWFEPSRGVIVLCPVLMYYSIEIGSSLFLSGSFEGFQGIFRIVSGVSYGCFPPLLDVDLSSLFIVKELPHRV
jgi:hypothetical protein